MLILNIDDVDVFLVQAKDAKSFSSFAPPFCCNLIRSLPAFCNDLFTESL